MSGLKVCLMVLLLPLLSSCASIDEFLFDANPDGTPIVRDSRGVTVVHSRQNDTQQSPQARVRNEELRLEAEALREDIKQQQAEFEAIKAREAVERQQAADQAEKAVKAVAVKEQLWVRVTFKSGQAGMTDRVRKALSDVAAKFSRQQSKQTLAVRAYSDDEPIGGYDGKQRSAHHHTSQVALSQARADAVKNVLVKGGVSSDVISAIGYGASGFIADNDTIEGRNKNRRVDIFLIGD